MEYRLKEEALIFGGKTLVATDIAVAGGLAKGIGNESRVSHLSKDLVQKAIDVIQKSVESAVDSVKVCLLPFLSFSKMICYTSFSA